MQSAKRIGSALEIFNADPYCEALAVSAFRGRQLSNLLFSLTENKPKNKPKKVILSLTSREQFLEEMPASEEKWISSF